MLNQPDLIDLQYFLKIQWILEPQICMYDILAFAKQAVSSRKIIIMMQLKWQFKGHTGED